MAEMTMYVAVSSEWGIGYKNQLLFSIPEDVKFFREMTTGTTVVMGRATLDSLPGGRPLKNRRNIVLSTNEQLKVENAEIVHNKEELFELIRGDEKVSVIGGETIFKILLPYCDRAWVTKVDALRPADRFFPNLDEMPEWEVVSESGLKTYNDMNYRFVEYINKKTERYLGRSNRNL